MAFLRHRAAEKFSIHRMDIRCISPDCRMLAFLKGADHLCRQCRILCKAAALRNDWRAPQPSRVPMEGLPTIQDQLGR
jgi:hypothetical protein